MAQTRRRRSTKHRGNAAGVVESRGRTGRKPTAAERDPKARQREAAKKKKTEKLDKPPTWRAAFFKAPMMALILFIFTTVLFKNVGQAAALSAIALLLYVPAAYYSDQWAWRRRMRRKAEERGRR